MKKHINKTLIVLSSLLLIVSCSDESFLKEERKDEFTTENAFLNKAQFETLIASNYRIIQEMYNSGDEDKDAWALGLGTDVGFWPLGDAKAYNDWNLVNPFEALTDRWVSWQYQIIRNSNTVIEAAQKKGVAWNNDAERDATIAEGRFFRGFAYRNLANIFGGMPIVDGPVNEPKVDFKRNTRVECWEFAKADLEYARKNLNKTAKYPGKVTKAAADHLLAEVNICLKDWDGAIAASTRVIDGTDGDYRLMTGRFGTRKNEPGKNIYWDLFRMGNQNYETGNKEAIWVAQFEDKISGGTVNNGRPTVERTWWNRIWLFRKAGYTGIAADSTGRGASFVRPTDHANYTIWKNTGNDLRNTEAVIKRKFYFGGNVPPYKKGDLIPKSFLTAPEDTLQYVYPNWSKFGTDKHINGIPDNGYIRDFYVIRLSETYLLRAEAYLGKGQKDLAAGDINVIHTRAQSPLITGADVDIDYILDERMRELLGEEWRMLTLCRLGKLYDRTSRFGYGPAKKSIKEKNNLFPIPQRVIDGNVGVVIEQNPGY